MDSRKEQRQISNALCSNETIVLVVQFYLLNVIDRRLKWRVTLKNDGNDEPFAVNVGDSTTDDELEVQKRVDLLVTEKGFVAYELKVLELESV